MTQPPGGFTPPPPPPPPLFPPGPPLPPEPSRPPRPPRAPRNPLLVALANAALPGAGYALLGRWLLALFAATGTVFLLAALLTVAERWCEIALLVWWAAGIAHGAYLADGPRGRAAWGRAHLLAGAAALAVLLLAGLLRFDGNQTAQQVAAAHEDGDCDELTARQDELWFGTRLADAPRAARGDELAEACDSLRGAGADLRAGLVGDTAALSRGFRTLAAVLPGNEQTTRATLDAFLRRVPAQEPCRVVEVTSWLRERKPSGDALDRSAEVADRAAPTALKECGDAHMGDEAWAKARTQYQELLAHYPDSTHADAARKGVTRATRAVELDTVRERLGGGSSTRPAYCDQPAKYSGAGAFGKGANRAVIRGSSTYTSKLPGGWRTDDPAEATAIVCVGAATNGDTVRTCLYENRRSPAFPHKVTFRKIKIAVKVYELRTGKLVADRSVQINGKSCPTVIRYRSYLTDAGPPSTTKVEPSKANIQDAFRPLLKR